MTTLSASAASLEQTPVDKPFTIRSVPSDPLVAHRMMTLGWRLGGKARIVKRTVGGARVIDINGSRIAVSRELTCTLSVEALA